MNRILALSYSAINTTAKTWSYKTITADIDVAVTGSCFLNKHVRYSTDKADKGQVAIYEEVKEIEKENGKTLLIDVREPEELKETGIIPGSINIPLGYVARALKDMSNEEFLEKYKVEKPNFHKFIIFSCKSGIRSAEAQALSQQLGYKNVKNYLGGWTDWKTRSENT